MQDLFVGVKAIAVFFARPSPHGLSVPEDRAIAGEEGRFGAVGDAGGGLFKESQRWISVLYK
jgi:hypothetical protein